MARPERHDADYFPFYVKDGKTLFILESKYGLEGIGFFTNLMRFLTRQTDHHTCIKDESDRLYFFAQIRCNEEIGIDMLNLMAKTGKIDEKLWSQHMVIVSEDLLESLKDAYKNRKNQIIDIAKIRVSYPDNEITYQENPVTSSDKPQRKGKETKGKETKESAPFFLPENIPMETWAEYMRLRVKKRATQTDYALNLILRELEKIKKEHGHDPVAIINQSIKAGWSDVYPLKDKGGNGNGSNAGRNPGGFRRSDPNETKQARIMDEYEEGLARIRAENAAAGDNPEGDGIPDFEPPP